MFTQHVTGFSKESASAALGIALSSAGGMAGEAENIHVLVQSVIKSAEGWIASVDIVIEPKIKIRRDEKPEMHPAQSSKSGQEKTSLPEPLLHPDPEILQREKERQAVRMKEEMALSAQEGRAALSHLYLLFEYEMLYRPVAPAYQFDYVHVIPQGSLWDAVKKHAPDMDLYEAVHKPPPGFHILRPAGEAPVPVPARKSGKLLAPTEDFLKE